MEKHYNPKETDSKWYRFWEEGDFFHADPDSGKPPYAIAMPPPNVTGNLHMGHALVSTVQDILIRWKRMSGFETLWVPGIDHAGIATQTVVERQLLTKTGKRRKEFPREEFLKHVWNWKEKNESEIVGQLKVLGCSCDWSRYRFTMDEGATRAVRTLFKRLYDDGLIYQGDYLVNWDPVTQTALADEEIEYVERKTSLWHIRYPLTDGSGELVVATTRPETMLGDTAVAVHPDDPRYKGWVGKTIRLPLTDREIPIIADKEVDPEFGTGAVKITPAHDPNDYQMGLRHNLPMINIMTGDGRLNTGEFAGKTMEEARPLIAERLPLAKVEPHTHRVGLSYRSKAVIEPHISKQWFVKMSGFATKLHDAVESGQVSIIPESWKSTYFHWVDNLRDWCISRQLWWGHQIPIWHHIDEPHVKICYDGVGVPPEVAAEPEAWRQDPDALDTWFSSGLWPLTVLGWPEKTPDLKKFYPTSVLVTGHDILFFWVARMIMMGEYAGGEVPFPDAFLHGLVYGRSYWREDRGGGINYCSQEERQSYDRGTPTPADVHSKWEKLSKSKGNVIDPVEIIDEYGTDAMRMALLASAPQNAQIDLDRRRFEEFRNFTNKVWNGARFVMMHLEDVTFDGDIELPDLEDRWIVEMLRQRTAEIEGHLERYAFDHAAMAAYEFFWKEFCAYYLEASKPALFGKRGSRPNKQRLLAFLLCQAVRLLHPMAPFITEEIFQLLKAKLPEVQGTDPMSRDLAEALSSPGCIVAPYPTPLAEPESTDLFEQLQEVVYTIRNIRGELKVSPGAATHVTLVRGAELEPYGYLIGALVRIGELRFADTEPELPFSASGSVGSIAVIVEPPQEDRAKEKARLEKEREKQEAALAKIDAQLSNAAYVERAPAELVQKSRDQRDRLRSELQELEKALRAASE
jgi:valyl-tRNA synthetase